MVVIDFADTAHPQILNYIQAKRLAGRPVLIDTLLYLATSGYIEVFNAKDPTNAPRVGRLATPVADIDVEDTLLYSISDDTFRVFSFADPANPRLLGACADSGYALDYDGGYAYLRDRWGMYILDVRDPTNPHRVASWGTDIAGVKVRGNHCYVAQGSAGSGNLYVLNVSNPASPWQEGVLSGITCEGMYLVDTLLFTPEFYVVNIADSSRPTLVSQVPAGGGEAWVHPSLKWGVTAGWTGGLRVLNLSDIENPMLDTTMLEGDETYSISVSGQIACVTHNSLGVLLFDISDPSRPREVGRCDTASIGHWPALVNADSLAYAGGFVTSPREVLHVLDISDPANPVKVGGGVGFNPVEAMVLRDSFLYCAEDNKFEVFNVANPRQPVWMGRCDAYSSALGLAIQDSWAYVAPRLQVISVANPANPVKVYEGSGNRLNGRGIAVRDTFAYFLSNYDTLWVYSISNPYAPAIIGWSPSGSHRGFDLVLLDSYAYAGCQDFRVFSLASPAQPTSAGYYETPYYAMNIDTSGGYIYVACHLAGVEVLEMLPVGVNERRLDGQQQSRPEARVTPNPVSSRAMLTWSGLDRLEGVVIRDVAGRVVWALNQKPAPERRELSFDLTGFGSGVYFMEVDVGIKTTSVKLVKQ